MPEVTSPVLGDCKNTRNYNSFFSSPDQIWTPTSYSGGDSLSSISDLFAFNKPQSSTMAGWQSVPNYSTPITQYKAQERLADLRLNASHLSYLADRNISNMTDFRSVNQNEDSGDVRNKHFQRPKLDLSFTSYGYQTPQQYRSSPTYSDGSDPLISHHFMERSKPNTPDESDISISPETVADLKNRINIIPYGSSPLTEHNLVNMERISNEKLSAGDNVHQTHNLLSSLYTNQNWNHPRYGSPIASQSPVYEKKSPPWSSTKSKNDNYSNQIENRSLNRNSYNGLHIDPTFTWSGQLPKVVHSIPNYSCKIFLGGVPWDITEDGLIIAFSQFGPVKIEWPGTSSNISQPKGYVYVIMQSDQMVKQLLESCTRASDGGNYYFKISSRKMKNKEVQVIPWIINDSNYYVKHPSQKLDPTQTVFVGALHGMITAQGLFKIMDDLFGNVSYAGIDTDKHKYPMGSSRVTFSSYQSYTKAVAASFIEVKTPKFCKKIEINPYLEDSACSVCNIQLGPYFCKDQLCYRYYCRGCWNWKHTSTLLSAHRPLMRNSKHTPTSISSPPTFTSPNRNSFSPMRNQFEIEQ